MGLELAWAWAWVRAERADSMFGTMRFVPLYISQGINGVPGEKDQRTTLPQRTISGLKEGACIVTGTTHRVPGSPKMLQYSH